MHAFSEKMQKLNQGSREQCKWYVPKYLLLPFNCVNEKKVQCGLNGEGKQKKKNFLYGDQEKEDRHLSLDEQTITDTITHLLPLPRPDK